MKIEDRNDVQDFIRDKIVLLLNCCSLKEQEMFYKIFGNDLKKLNKSDLGNAIDLCERTVKKNENRNK